jgi:hypothetical protein
MSAVPQTCEEAFAALQRFIDHPRTLETLRTMTPRTKAQFLGNRPRGSISKKRAPEYETSWTEKIVGQLWVNMYHVAPMVDGERTLVIYTESEFERSIVHFGIWNMSGNTMREVSVRTITNDLSKLQFILKVLEHSARGTLISSNLEVEYI